MLKYQKKINIEKFEKVFEEISQKIDKIKLPKGFSESILYAISELLDNVKQHSKTKETLIKIRIINKDSEIEIRDKGIGLKGSYLTKGIFPKDDFSAIEFALAGLSAKDLKERGFGFYNLKKITNKLLGRMEIKTGKAKAIIEKDKIILKKLNKDFKGVLVKLVLAIKEINLYKIIG